MLYQWTYWCNTEWFTLLFYCMLYISITRYCKSILTLMTSTMQTWKHIYKSVHNTLGHIRPKGVVVHVFVIQMTYKSRTHYPIVKKKRGHSNIGPRKYILEQLRTLWFSLVISNVWYFPFQRPFMHGIFKAPVQASSVIWYIGGQSEGQRSQNNQ